MDPIEYSFPMPEKQFKATVSVSHDFHVDYITVTTEQYIIRTVTSVEVVSVNHIQHILARRESSESELRVYV